jgi:hypothetical protein
MATVPGCRMSYTAWQVWPCTEARPDAGTLQALERRAGDVAAWDGASGWIYPQLLLDCVVWTSTVLAQRSLLAETGGFDTGLRIGEDLDLWLRASRLTPILRVKAPYALYRMHPASITKSMPTENFRAHVIERALAQWGLRSPDGGQADAGAVRAVLAKCWSDFGGLHLQCGNVKMARQGARQALRVSLAHTPGWKVLLKSLLPAQARAPQYD